MSTYSSKSIYVCSYYYAYVTQLWKMRRPVHLLLRLLCMCPKSSPLKSEDTQYTNFFFSILCIYGPSAGTNYQVLLNMCPHTAIYVSSYCYMCVRILLNMCPHTAIYVSSYCYMCVRILLYVSSYVRCWQGLASQSS